ncbi:MAG: NAD-dependent epimerase/dehydratase family protein [Planctomycetota bacterium]
MHRYQRVLVTGGAGFLGSRLVARLSTSGTDVVALDDLSSPAARGRARPATLLVGDVRDAALLGRAFDGVDLVVHLASVVGVDVVTAQPERTTAVIRDGTRAVLARARAAGCPLIFFSSSEVTDPPRQGPRATYAAAKLAAEAEVLAAAHAIPVTILRPFNVVGPGQEGERGMVLPALIAAARRGEALPVHGDGRQERSLLHVDDLVDAVLALLAAAPAPPGGEVLEIGGEERVSVQALAQAILQLTGSTAGLCQVTSPPLREDRPRRSADLTALRRRIAFRPTRPLAYILRDVLAHA